MTKGVEFRPLWIVGLLIALVTTAMFAQRPEKQDTNSVLRRLEDKVDRLQQSVGSLDEHVQKCVERQ